MMTGGYSIAYSDYSTMTREAAITAAEHNRIALQQLHQQLLMEQEKNAELKEAVAQMGVAMSKMTAEIDRLRGMLSVYGR